MKKTLLMVMVFVVLTLFVQIYNANAYFESDGKQLAPQEEDCLQRYVAFLTAMRTLDPSSAATYESIMSSGRYSERRYEQKQR